MVVLSVEKWGDTFFDRCMLTYPIEQKKFMYAAFKGDLDYIKKHTNTGDRMNNKIIISSAIQFAAVGQHRDVIDYLQNKEPNMSWVDHCLQLGKTKMWSKEHPYNDITNVSQIW